jgi:hypothetical protein
MKPLSTNKNPGNVIPLVPRRKMPAVKLLTIMVKTNEPPEPGDLVAFHFENPKSYLLGIFEGPTGRDHNGRFVNKGSPDECHAIDGLRYRLGEGVTVLGKVINGAWPDVLLPELG